MWPPEANIYSFPRHLQPLLSTLLCGHLRMDNSFFISLFVSHLFSSISTPSSTFSGSPWNSWMVLPALCLLCHKRKRLQKLQKIFINQKGNLSCLSIESDEDNNDHDDNSINLPREKDLYITFLTSLPKLGRNCEWNGTQNNVNVAPKLQMDNVFY